MTIEFVDAAPHLPFSAVVRGGRTKARAIARFAQALDFPSWFGHNLDALADALGDASARDGMPWTLLWQPARRLVAEHPDDYAALVDVLRDLCERPGVAITIVGPPDLFVVDERLSP